MRLNGIKDNPGAKKTRVRIGRGIGSGLGKMGGRGGKGQTARSGVAIGGFEGGQMPLHRRLPKRGFNKWRPQDFNEINVGALQKAIDDKRLDGSKPIDVAALVEAGIVRRAKDGVRLLGDGEIKAKIAITVNHATAKAKAAVEKAGGSISVIEQQGARSRRRKAQEIRGQESGFRQEASGCEVGGIERSRGDGIHPSSRVSYPEAFRWMREPEPGRCVALGNAAAVRRRHQWFPLPSSLLRT